MRFGCFVPQGWRLDLVDIPPADQWRAMRATAQAIEAAGYESLWVYDHFHTVPVVTQEATHEAWTLMAALAATTDTVRLGQMCTSVGYRNPAYLAKVAATVDLVSGGRVELGIGAGWYEHEYLGYGYPFPSAGTRIAQLAEAVEVIKRLWTEDVVHHEGDHFRLEGGICRPAPLQDPHPPVWVAGGGERKTLRVAAAHADYTNFTALPVEEFVHKSEVLARHCVDVDRPFEQIVRTGNLNVVCEETEADVQARLDDNQARIERFAGPDKAAAFRRSFEPMAGTPEQLVKRVRPLRDAGLAYAIVYFAEAAYDRAGLERFMREVAPAL